MNPEPNPRIAATIEWPKLDPAALAEHLLQSAKDRARWQVGLEFEVIGYTRSTLQRISPEQVQSLMAAFVRNGAVPLHEGNQIVAVSLPNFDITLEPGGQIEFSGLPTARIADTQRHLRAFLRTLHTFARASDTLFVALGFDPLRTLAEQRWISKRRYAIMRPYLRTRGGHAWNMMVRTAAIQVSVDFADENDLAQKYVFGNRAGPFVAAMFANSPFADGRLTGLKSTRYAAWLDTDPDRTGAGFGSLDESFDLQRYISDVLRVPLFFVERAGVLQDVAGWRLSEIPGADVRDFDNLLSMIFTEARVRKYIEMRSADSASPKYALALMAFWKGITYCQDALRAALEAVPLLEQPAYRALQMAVAKEGLAAHCEGVRVLEVARRLVKISYGGLAAVAHDELPYLAPLFNNVVDLGVCPADLLLAKQPLTAEAALEAASVA